MRTFLLIVLSFFTLLSATAQQGGGVGPKEKSISNQMKVKKQIRRETREKRRAERAERKAVKKHHKRIQTKQVRKRMKSSKSTATRNNLNKKEFFVKRWFTKKGKPRVKKNKKD